MSGYRRTTRARQSQGRCFAVSGLVVFVLVLAGIVTAVINAAHVEYRTCTVVEKDRTTDQQGSSDARVYTADCGTLRVGDSLLDATWSSSDTYAAISPGQTYRFKLRGYRIPLFSMFPNIVAAEPEVTR